MLFLFLFLKESKLEEPSKALIPADREEESERLTRI